MTETIVLDASSIAVNRTQLDITSWVAANGPDWGDAEIQAYMAEQAVGSSPVDYRIPNRQIKIPLVLRDLGGTTFATVRQQIQQKAALFQREGGWIMRQFGSAFNWVTNPSFEYDTVGTASAAGWANAGTGLPGWTHLSNTPSTILVSSAQHFSGANSLSVTTSINSGGIGMNCGVLLAGSYVASAWVRGNAGSEPVQIVAGNNATSPSANLTCSTSFQQVTVAFTADGTNPVFISVRSNTASAQTYFVDAALIASGSTAPAYFDGDTAGYGWLGTPGNSPSNLQPGGRLYADIVNATLHLGGSWLQAYRSADIDAVLSLETIPDWYGDEIQLSDHVETVLPHLTFTEPVVNGNHPGRVRLVVDNDQAVDQLGLIWGFQARNYNAGTTAALYYEAETLALLNGGTVAALSGASGGTAVYHNTLPANNWVPMLQMAMVGGTTPLTHAGSYRAWARCYAAGTFLPQVQLQWGAAGLAAPQVNDPIQIPGTAAFYMLDLGEIRIDPPPVGTGQWTGAIQVKSNIANDPVAIDNIYFQPLDESAGKLQPFTGVPATSVQAGPLLPGTATDGTTIGSIAWTNPLNILAIDATSTSGYAESLGSVATSHYLISGNFGFALPSVATVTGIQVTIYRLADLSNRVRDNAVRLVKAGTVQTGDRTKAGYWTINETSVTYGGPTDLWGGSWLYSDINNSGFGVALSAIAGATAKARVDAMTITVYYTMSSGFSAATDAVIYASKTAELRTDGMFRQISGGTVYAPVSTVIGDLPRIPPSGLESRTVRCSIWSSRGDLNQLPDSGIDDLSARITYRPSYLVTP